MRPDARSLLYGLLYNVGVQPPPAPALTGSALSLETLRVQGR
jgi:hypothetical protein